MIIYTIPLLFGLYLKKKSTEKIRNKIVLLFKNSYDSLPDIIHDNFPKINALIPDIFLLICIFALALKWPLLLNAEHNTLCLGICTILRSYIVQITIIPTCISKLKPTTNIYINRLISIFDLMFSGHTLFFIAIGNMLNNWLIPILGPFLLIIARQHYTIDVFMSGLVYNYVYYKTKYLF